MKILVTGAAGFIGYFVCKQLIGQGHQVIGLDNINDYYDRNLKYARLQELGILKSLLKVNRIDPVWHGKIPDLQTASKRNGRGDAKKYFKKQSQRMFPEQIPSSNRRDSNRPFARSI